MLRRLLTVNALLKAIMGTEQSCDVTVCERALSCDDDENSCQLTFHSLRVLWYHTILVLLQIILLQYPPRVEKLLLFFFVMIKK